MGEEMDRNAFISRVGTFFLLVGGGLMFLFIISDMAQGTTFGYFFGGLITLGFGWYLKRITTPPPKPKSGRFEGLRKWQQQRREAAKKREEAKKAKQQGKK